MQTKDPSVENNEITISNPDPGTENPVKCRKDMRRNSGAPANASLLGLLTSAAAPSH